jgi:dTMP kinase
MFIVIEGIEGSGKSTLVDALARALRTERRDVVTTREPGGTPVSDAIRELFLSRSIEMSPLTEVLLVNAARAEHVSALIRPALASGIIVICDRFVDSTLAYQGYGRGLSVHELRTLCDVATGGLEPDLVFVLDLPVSAARGRLRARAAPTDRIETEGDAFHERVRQGFLELAHSPRHRVLDATLPTERLAESALQELRARLSLRAT